MKVLIVKTSSMGDVIHALPAVTEAAKTFPDAEFSWVVEEDLSDIPAAHPAIGEVIPVAIRRWRKAIFSAGSEFMRFRRELASRQFDVVIDSQGLIKSALIARLATGVSHGFDGASAREPLASICYQKQHRVDPSRHAIDRQLSLFAQSLGYESSGEIDYGLKADRIDTASSIVLLHGTTWPSKEWPESCWRELAERAAVNGYDLVLPAGDDREHRRAQRISDGLSATIMMRPRLRELMAAISRAAGVVSVDTGLGHLGAAFSAPVIGIFGATDPRLTGMKGAKTQLIVSNHLPCIPCRKRDCQFRQDEDSSSIYPPCYEHTTPEAVWLALVSQIDNRPGNPG